MENIVLQDERKEQIKIVDFGLSNIYASDDPLRTHCGSPEYAAPELFVVGKRYGPEVDLWSLGVVLYGMTIGRLPFLCPRGEWTSSEERRRKLMIQINRGLTSIQERAMYQTSNECRNLINRLLVPSARERITIREILNHPWIHASSKSNLHLGSENDLNVSDHATIVNEIATAMRITVGAVEAEIIRRKYGEIGGMYNIKVHKLHQTTVATATAYQLAPQFPGNSMHRTKDVSPSSAMTTRTAKGNLRNRTSTNSDNNDNRVVIMRRGEQPQDRSIKKSPPRDSATWNWRLRPDHGNRCSERRNSGIYHDTFIMNNVSLSQRHASQITKNQGGRISQDSCRDKAHQAKNPTSHANHKRMEKSGGFSGICVTNCEITPSAPILRVYSRVSSESVPASRVKESFHKKILIPPWRYRVGSAKTRKNT